MKKTYSLIFVASAFALLLASIVVLPPKAVRAAVATLIRDQDNAARHPFSFQCTQTFGPAGGIINIFGECVNLTQGQEYVVQNVSFSASGTGFNAASFSASCKTGGEAATFIYGTIPSLAIIPTGVLAQQSFPVTAYCDPTGSIVLGPASFNGVTPSGSGSIDVSGYYVTLP